MLTLLLPFSWILIYSSITACLHHTVNWRSIVIRACLIWGTYLAFAAELLSLINRLDQIGLLVALSIPCMVGAVFTWRKSRSKPIRVIFSNLKLDGSEWMTLSFILIILGISMLVARLSPPQTWDSLNYHLPRIAHWAQNRSIHHFITGIEVQNVISPGGEIIQSYVYILDQGDRWITQVQWSAMLLSVVIVSWIASLLGANRKGQLLASLVAASLPMGIIQASSTANDYILTLWLLCTAAETIQLLFFNPGKAGYIFSGMAAGLALWTKPVAFPYLLPFGIAVLISMRFKKNWHRLWSIIPAAGVGLLFFVAINSGYWIRNQITYGNPFGDLIRLNTHRNELLTPAGIFSNLIRNMAYHTGLPWGRANELIFESIIQIHEWINVDIEDPRTTSVGPYPWMALRTNEESAGNTLHAGFILLCFGLLIKGTVSKKGLLWQYGLICAGTFMLFSVIFKWQIFGSRYHLPFFLLFSPFIGTILVDALSVKISKMLPLLFTLCTIPWLFSIDSRPLIPNNQSLIGSILTTPEMDVRFANSFYQQRSYMNMANLIKEAECNRVGMSLGGIQTEYFIWYLLKAPHANLRIEWFVSGTQSEIYRDYDFAPCAVICELCAGPGSEFYNGIPRVYSDNEFTLYLITPQP
jgi:hypothetical protein